MLRIEKVFLQGFKSFCDPTEVAFDEEGITAVVGPNGCGKCVDGTTLITLADGRVVQIRELVEQALVDSRQTETLDDGILTRENPHRIEILSLNPQTLKLEPRPVAGFVKREATPHLLRVRTRSGREVSATPYHPLFTLDHGRLRALKAEELQVGTRIALPRRLPVGDSGGSFRSIEAIRRFRQNDTALRPGITTQVFVPKGPTDISRGCNPRMPVDNNCAPAGAPDQARPSSAPAGALMVMGNPFRGLHPRLISVGPFGTKTRSRLAAKPIDQSLDDFRASLAGQFRSIPRPDPQSDLIPSATSIVKEAARLAGVNLTSHPENHPELTAYIEERCLASRNGLLEVRQQIASLGATPEQARSHLDRLHVLATSDVFWDEIVSIEQVAPSDPWVYDLSIDETHNFVAGNIIVHNSNIADAVNWVIGEQRARALRGAKMEDVIFQGSRNRQPAGLAEVLLTMVVHETFEIRSDNGKENTDATVAEPPEVIKETDAATTEGAGSEGGEPAGEPAAEKPKPRRKVKAEAASRVFQEGERVTVGRRLYRTGESEYEMNGRTCRLRDVQDLFAGTGLGGAHYAIIEQGRIGQVLSAKPLDRRSLIEEAAGISKFKMRQHAAELKLDASRANLSRVTDIINEIERQQNSLKRQAARARRFQRLRTEMRELMRAVYVADYRATRTALADLESQWEAVAERETAAQGRITELEAAASEAAQEARGAESRLNETRAVAAGIDLETARSRQQHGYLSEQLQALGARADEFARDRETITGRSGFIEQETTRLRGELQAIEGEINAVGLALAADEDEHRSRLQRDAEGEQHLEETRRGLYEATTALERWRQLKRQFVEAVDRFETRRQGLAAERARAEAQAETNEQERLAIDAERAQREGRGVEVSGELSGVQTQLGAAREERTGRQQSLTSAHRDLTAVEHRLKSLVELDARHAYFSEAVQLVLSRGGEKGEGMQERDDRSFRALGTLADFVSVSPEDEATVETALRDELQYVLVPTFDDAFRAIDFLKAENAGRATLMVVGLHGGEGPAPIISSESGDSEHRDHESDNPQSDNSQSNDYLSGNNQSGDKESDNYESLNDHAGGDRAGRRVLLDLLGLRPEFAAIFARALPQLAAARIVGTAVQAIESAAALTGKEAASGAAIFVTRAGERVVAGRLVTGGSSAEGGGGVLALKREITELSERFNGLTAAVAAAEAGLREVDGRIQDFDVRRGALDAEMRQIEKDLAVLRTRWQQSERDRERIATHLRVVGQETMQVESELAENQGKLAQASTQTVEAEQSHAEAETSVAAAQSEMAELRRAAEQRAQELSRRRAEFAARTERRRGLQNDLQRLENEARDLSERLHRSQLSTVETEEQMRSLQQSLAETAEQLAALTGQQERMGATLNEQSAALTAARERLDALDLEVRAAREASAQAREERARLELERVRLTAALEHLAESCYHELGEQLTAIVERLERASSESDDSVEAMPSPSLSRDTDLDDEDEEEEEDSSADLTFWQVPENFDLAAAKARLEELRSKIEALGPINMMALDELTEVEDRYRFLVAQRADIEQAVADTEAAITEIKRRSRERFADAFHAINENFQHTFQELFGGGRGEMRLIDESDILESGIEIIAQPPGKRLQNVLLLSGGEKAMAAIALVLAIFKYRPSPFCILDEVDAPLDEVNIGRFADKVLEMSAHTQFMIITHSKRTMEAARTLYGVTMEDPGVSKLISVRLT